MNKFLFTALLLVSFNVFAEEALNATVRLTPAGSFQVKTDKISGKVSKKDGGYTSDKLWVKVKSLKTGIDLRDKHLKERLNYKTNSKIEVTKMSAKNGKGKALFEMNGIKKPISFTYTAKETALTASFKINLQDFKVKDLKYMGVGAKDIVEINASAKIE